MKKNFFILFSVLFLASVAGAQDLRYPLRTSQIPLSGSGQGHTIDSSDDILDLIQNSQEEHAFTKISVNYAYRTGTPPTYKVGYQLINASGDCDGTYLTGTGGECSGTFTPPANGTWDSTAQDITMTASTCNMPVGQVCQRITYSSGTVNGGNNGTFLRTFTNNESYDKLEYTNRVSNGGAATRSGEQPAGGNTDGTRYWGHLSYSIGYDDPSSDTSPDEVGNTFKEFCPSTYRLAGCQIGITQGLAAGKSVKCILYNGTTVIDDCTIDTDAISDGFGGNINCYFDLAGRQTLTCGTAYNIGVQPQNTSSGLRLAKISYTSNNQMDGAWNTKAFSKISRTDAGSWTATATDRSNVYGILERYDSAPSGGVANLGKQEGGFQ